MRLFLVAAACCLLILVVSPAQAQGYPAKTVRVVVGFAPAGPVDNLARLLSRKLSESLGQQFVVDNRPGASGMIGAENVARSLPDGYALLMVPSTHAVNPSLYRKKMAFDTEHDFTPVSLVAESPFVLVVPARLPVKTVAELIAYARRQGQPLNYASAGVGGLPHLAGELFKSTTGMEATHIPYKGAAPATVDLLAGQVSFMFNNMLSAIPNIRDGRLRALALTTARRSSALPDVPTMQELGFKDYEVSGWYALLGPSGMDPAVVSRLNVETKRILRDPEVVRGLQVDGVEAQGSTPQALAALIHRDIAKWAAVVKASGATAD